MRILFVIGSSLYLNSSANLCHRAYIEGMVKLGHKVDLLCFSKKDVATDDSIQLPDIDNIYEYYGVSLYEKIAGRNKASNNPQVTNDTSSESSPWKPSLKSRVIKLIKTRIWNAYGAYSPSIAWFKNAKQFSSDKKYDVVISLYYPAVSHKVAKFIIEKKRIISDRWIQIWEDPWTFEVFTPTNYKKDKMRRKYFKQEKKLLNACKDIVYVSPITMNIQKEGFPECAEYMRWVPLPSYYKADLINCEIKENHYGYFGDYDPHVRELAPFYNVAVKKNLHFDICGSPYGILKQQANITVNPRMPLGKLREHENRVNVLVCLFNKFGGQIPGKVYQYAATNKTILAILDGTDEEKKILKDFFEPYNRFVFCDNNELSISQAVAKIESGDLGEIRNIPIDAFSVEKIARMILGD